MTEIFVRNELKCCRTNPPMDMSTQHCTSKSRLGMSEWNIQFSYSESMYRCNRVIAMYLLWWNNWEGERGTVLRWNLKKAIRQLTASSYESAIKLACLNWTTKVLLSFQVTRVRLWMVPSLFFLCPAGGLWFVVWRVVATVAVIVLGPILVLCSLPGDAVGNGFWNSPCICR